MFESSSKAFYTLSNLTVSDIPTTSSKNFSCFPYTGPGENACLSSAIIHTLRGGFNPFGFLGSFQDAFMVKSPVLGKKSKDNVKKFSVVKVTGDGRCLFRSLARGLSYNQNVPMTEPSLEAVAADELRLAVYDALCRDTKRAKSFKEVDYTIDSVEGGREKYCKRLRQPTFWGGELEILVLSKMLQVPIYIYKPSDSGKGFTPIVKYGQQWAQGANGKKGRKPVYLLYSDGNHYDLLKAS